MSIWCYASCYPAHGSNLKPSPALASLIGAGFYVDESVYGAVISEDGHLHHATEINLSDPCDVDAKKRLAEGEQLLVTCVGGIIIITMAVATQHANPSLRFSWSLKMFRELSESQQQAHLSDVRQAALASNAEYVVLVVEPPDYFLEDNFLEVDGERYLDKKINHGLDYSIDELWIRQSSQSAVPSGTEYLQEDERADGFVIYREPEQTVES